MTYRSVPRPPAVPDREDARAIGMTIRVSKGTGTGFTPLAAFDSALRAAGVGHFNLVRLSSVIPPGAVVLQTAPGEQVPGGHGDRLYCVYAEAIATTRGQVASAGMTWARNDEDAAGLFVEHGGDSSDAVEQLLTYSLESMMSARGPGYRCDGRALSAITCEDKPVCAVVVAAYQARPWALDGLV